MKTIIQSYKNLLCQIAVLVLGATMLAGCGEGSEKADLLKITAVFYEAGVNEKVQEEYQQKLKNVKTEAEAKQVIGEMVGLLEKTPAKLEGLNLSTEAGKSLRDKLAKGFRGVVESTKELTALDMKTDMDKAMAAQTKLLQAQKDLLDAQNEFIELAKKHGVDLEKMKK
ncbi:hypothetical protein [Alysiella filiformis]|uniref:Lipoprotein n=1 Tax=Alysiella filiformis DSM 16848 TaxID=1120981 RepID=A0A286E4D2_9NEIS|nr:hypothetical protein [Alysiella filiformis]QMT30999.1 hypothetical protein H3L97_09760 [Alysiella filiformis]UBQ56013.1 hypothetical protein JF568_10710 [Alysiella filiformis DSM 16848]SOD65721.1 hypothetical protein SAMN02746062_00398 [Alysiella filiformis DSM 16848]